MPAKMKPMTQSPGAEPRRLQRSIGTVIAVALSSQEPRAGYPLTLELTAAKLPKRSWVKMSQIRTLSTARIGKRLGRASEEELAKVLDGLLEIVG